LRRTLRIRRLLQGRRGITESYRAEWHGRGVLEQRVSVRVDRYRNRAELECAILKRDDDLEWRAAQTSTRPLTQAEWEQFSSKVEAGFWHLLTRDRAAAIMDGDSWFIEGYRRGIPPSLEYCRGGTYHSVSRSTGNRMVGTGTEIYALGMWMAERAGCGDLKIS